MRKFSNVLTGLLAAGVCVFVTIVAMDAGNLYTMIYNLVFLAVMLIIMLTAWIVGFRRMGMTVKGMERASSKLMTVYKNKDGLADVTAAGSQIFGVDYLDRKYQEYLAFLRKTNSPCDIGDYIGEYEINNYTHHKLVEMVPDILTSLGILGTFVGLVWGLRGFDPQTYEAMTSSVSSLVDGIKVAFITSIYGITLSLVFSYWLRGSWQRVSESLDNFLDKYYLIAVPPTDTSAISNILSNQKEQTKVMQDMADGFMEQVASSFEGQIGSAMDHMNQTMDHFTQIVTTNQEEIMQNVAMKVAETIKGEFMEELLEMRVLLKESNRSQREYLQFMDNARESFENDFLQGEKKLARAMDNTSEGLSDSLEAMQLQQEHLRDFTEYMSQVVGSMARMSDIANRSLENVINRLEKTAPLKEAADLEVIADKLDHLAILMEKQQRQQSSKKGLFR